MWGHLGMLPEGKASEEWAGFLEALQSCSLSPAAGYPVHSGGGVHVPQGLRCQFPGQAL